MKKAGKKMIEKAKKQSVKPFEKTVPAYIHRTTPYRSV